MGLGTLGPRWEMKLTGSQREDAMRGEEERQEEEEELATQLAVHLVLGAPVDGQRADPSPEPLVDLAGPVAHQAGGRHHQGLVYLGPEVGALAQQRPHEGDALQRLPQAHLVGHDAAVRSRDPPARHTLPEEPDPLRRAEEQPAHRDQGWRFRAEGRRWDTSLWWGRSTFPRTGSTTTWTGALSLLRGHHSMFGPPPLPGGADGPKGTHLSAVSSSWALGVGGWNRTSASAAKGS